MPSRTAIKRLIDLGALEMGEVFYSGAKRYLALTEALRPYHAK